MVHTHAASLTLTTTALLLVSLAGLPPAGAQTLVEQVLCPFFTPENPVKWCIQVTGRGCVVVRVDTFGIPGSPDVDRKVCVLP